MKLYKKIFTAISISFIIFLSSSTKISASDPIKSDWTSGPPLNYIDAWQVSFISDDKLNTIAGAGSAYTISNMSVSNINNDGSLNQWITYGNLPEGLYWHSLTKKDNLIYILGGATYPPSTSTNTVYKGTLNNGIVQELSTTTPLPTPLSLGSSVIANGKIYFAGGADATSWSISNKVYVANINSDGTIGDWKETTPLLQSLFGHGMIETGSKIVIIGGRSSFLTASDKVYEATILIDGTLGEWVEKSPLPQPNANFGIAKVNNTVFAVGGTNYPNNIPTNLNNVYYANIEDGSIGTWSESQNRLPKPTTAGSLTASNTHLYYTGGYNTDYTNDVWVVEIQPGINYPSLSVPDIKQYTKPWSEQTYDTANIWASYNPTIKAWGCALTSASMILQYYNHIIFPDALNNWLKSQKDGYLRNGLLNWLAISRYTIKHKTSSSPALEYRKLQGNPDLLINELSSERPAILEEPGHFVVAKSQLQDSFGINDPAYASRDTLKSYQNNFLSIQSYKPSYTNLSYILLATDPNITLRIFDANGVELTNYTYSQEHLINDEDKVSKSSELNTFVYPTPADGKYIIEITGATKAYTLDSYLYDRDGNVIQNSQNGTISTNQKDLFEITIGKTNEIRQIITFDALIEDLDNSYIYGYISKDQAYNILKSHLQQAKIMFTKGKINSAKGLLRAFTSNLSNFPETFISQEASRLLSTQSSLLLNSI